MLQLLALGLLGFHAPVFRPTFLLRGRDTLPRFRTKYAFYGDRLLRACGNRRNLLALEQPLDLSNLAFDLIFFYLIANQSHL